MMPCDKTGKQSFVSEQSADHALSEIQKTQRRRRLKRGKVPMRSYRCNFCDQWHLTSSSWTSDRRQKGRRAA